MVDKDKNKFKKVDKTETPKIVQGGDVLKIREQLNLRFNSQIAPEVKNKEIFIIPTGILSMDLAIGNGGLVTGRVMDIFGWEGTGKTLMCMTIGGYIQRCDKRDSGGNVVKRTVAFLDAEGTFSKKFASSAGMDPDSLILVQSTPEKILSGEDYFDIMAMLIGQGVDYIIVDSCPALTPMQVMMNDMGQGQKATLSQLMSQGLNKITPLVNASGQTLVHFINQKRQRPMSGFKQDPETETGGNALKFYSSYRFKIVRTEDIIKQVLGVDGQLRNKKVGVRSCVSIIKNKTAPEPPVVTGTTYHFEFDVYFEPFKDGNGIEYHRGVDIVKDYFDTGVRSGVIKQAGAWFSFGNIKAQGEIDFIKKVREKPEIMADIRTEVFAKMGTVSSSIQ